MNQRWVQFGLCNQDGDKSTGYIQGMRLLVGRCSSCGCAKCPLRLCVAGMVISVN